jgi:phage shock protein PspC (stress-responsive transcriptional regulator)
MTVHQSTPQPDNLLGICHSLGETFGINPLILRMALIFGVLISAQITIGIYLIAGVAVAIAHLVTRERRGARAKQRDRVTA